MCGRISQVIGEEDLSAALGGATLTAAVEERFNLGPAQDILTVLDRRGQRRVGRMRWGVKPAWSKKLVINAQWEKAATGRGFWGQWRRTVVPASGFYEWRREGRRRQAIHIHQGTAPLLMAGLWRWEREAQERSAVSVVLTMGAEPWIAGLHHRQPVLLTRAGLDAWLSGGEVERVDGSALCLDPVSEYVNKISNEGRGCWAPA
jgi:putative SOS response-associated peptidase YedK